MPVAFLSKRPNFRLERNLLSRDEDVRKRSSSGMVLRVQPDLGLSVTFPVCRNLFSSRLIVDPWRWKCRATSLADMSAVSIPMALSRCSNVIHVIQIIDFLFFPPVFVLTIRKLSNCVLCYLRWITRFAVHILHVIFMKVKIYDYIMV